MVDFTTSMEFSGSKAKPFFLLMTEKQKEVVEPKINTRKRTGREECNNCSKAFTNPMRVSSSLFPSLANASLLSKFKMRKDGNKL